MMWQWVGMMEGHRRVLSAAPWRQTPLLGGLCSSLPWDILITGGAGARKSSLCVGCPV